MSTKYGGAVRDKELCKRLDWGQALARGQYGEDWNNLVDEPNQETVEIAKSWEDKLPDWIGLE